LLPPRIPHDNVDGSAGSSELTIVHVQAAHHLSMQGPGSLGKDRCEVEGSAFSAVSGVLSSFPASRTSPVVVVVVVVAASS
jgi:hypothetical protein